MGATLSKKVDDNAIKNEASDYPVVMYSKTQCGYCQKAKLLFNEEGIDFKEMNLDLKKTQMEAQGQNFQVVGFSNFIQASFSGLRKRLGLRHEAHKCSSDIYLWRVHWRLV